ncbi:galactokinase [Wenjunlia vitaminophila]|uniref:Galactokinase n=1 Tax=Wenjunlia vitaminophila TaxID=76728 RepID=A0A0T6LSH1_WENVI|nr:galactokinase [Wenjunlia vitaminophila]KRV48849.1 galactokinase [Wenjunlia vitaminophila]
MTANDTASAFTSLYGHAPTGVWAAPGRVNLIGEHTDYNEGFVLPLALPHTVEAAVRPRTDGRLRVHSGQAPDGLTHDLAVGELTPRPGGGWVGYPAGVVWALRDAGHPVDGADIHLNSDVPTGAGLSSSAALECAVAFALNDVYELGLPATALARFAQRAENAFVGVPCGVLDQMASACCTEGHALHLDTRDLAQRQVPFDLASLGLRLLVVDTQVKHDLADGGYAERRAGCEAAAASLGLPALRDLSLDDLDTALAALPDATSRGLVRHIVTENDRVNRVVALLDSGQVRDVGPLLTESHASMRDDFVISCPELDLAVDTANAAGALGARMTGGGFGGSAIVLVEEDAVDPVSAAVHGAFAAAGHRPPRMFPAVPGPGARRLR